MKYLFIEENISKKIDKFIDIYNKLINQNNNRSKNIMILVPNNRARITYLRKLNLSFSEELKVTTYLSFIKKEIIKFWPLVLERCDKIEKNTVSPTFISSSLSDYIINSEVENKRNLEGYFDDITSTSGNISKSINTNINQAARGLIDFITIGEKIYLSKKNRESLNRFSYSQMNEIIENYINILLSNGMVDNSLCIYLYNNYLLKDERYISFLKKEISYLIVDSFESCSNAEIEFIDLLKEDVNDLYINFNSTRDYSVFNNIDMDCINNLIRENFKVSNDIFKNISINDLLYTSADIYLDESSQLYNEMISEVCNKVIELVNSSTSPKDIAIISPVNNTVLDYQIKNILENNNLEVFNSKKDKKIIDYPYANALVVATCIFYDYIELIKEEEFISFIEIILDVNRIQAFKIFKNKDEHDSYLCILKYINSKKENKLKISEFLIQFYIDKMLNLKDGRKNVHICKNIINESEIFTENISLLNLDKNKEKERIFIEALKSTINDYYSGADIDRLNDSNKVLITTPYFYISSNIQRPIQLWVDIGSNAWNMKIEKDISNVVVLRKSFNENKIYTDDMEEGYKRYYLYNMVYNLLKNAKRVYAYKSEYTVNGYIQESILYSLLLKILDKGEIEDE
ncbi:hypothetical protein [Clostridium sp. CCUG 7971]|uniref:hypothetical protein n=1 Tax=Clostridium sp. CCUG 7971 TaxID=2811414 RepID=UPI001ABB7B2D|nr:hypothetical protein [Clostridium sp. CCUG 7971]MBO3443137.1 hypothetical protein [Clostridium sp. CCUG 7971]